MKRFLLFFSISLLTLLFLFFFIYKAQKRDSHFIDYSGNEEMEHEDGMQKAMFQEFLMTRDPALNAVPTERIIAAKKRMEEIDLSIARAAGTNQTTSLSWQERGPNNIGGRTRALLVDRSDATGNTVFAAGVGGGLWKTSNFKSATPVWTIINDFFANIAITCIKQSPVNASEMYFGTGEGYNNFDAIQGLGIWKSTNGGITWAQLSSTTNLAYVNDLEFDNNGYLYAATRSTVAGLRGIIRSTDNGASWTQVVTDPIPTAIPRGADLERAANGDMYATLGIFSTGHIFRSPANGTNTGISGSWTDITPPSIVTNKDERIELAICPNNSSRIYAMSQDSITPAGAGGGIANLFRSDNNGVSWTILKRPNWCDRNSTSTDSDFSRKQAWYDLILSVDPNNDATVLAGGVVVMKSSNAGSTWAQATRWITGSCSAAPIIHADIHEIQFLNSSEIIVCTDGGIYYSNDGGASFINKNFGYNVTEYYGMALASASGSNTMIAGAQDNGSHLFNSLGINSVSSITGGDGGFCFIDKTNNSVWITSNPGGYFNILRNNGSTSVGTAGNGGGRFVSVADYADTINILYAGDADGLYRQVFNVESGTASQNTVDLGTQMGTNRQVSCVKVDPNDETTIWLGCSVSETANVNVTPLLLKVIRANNPATGPPSNQPSATAFTGPSLPAGAYISSIDIEKGNSNHMILTVSNYGVASVWESNDGGSNWSSLDNNGVNLPDMPIRWAIFIPSGYSARTTATASIGGIMLATELGVWTTTGSNGTSTVWTANNTGLANVRTDQLVLRNSDKLVAAATHGRGIFTTLLLSGPLPTTLLNFEGHLQQNNILLQWSTSYEFNSSHFELEKSFNGTSFHNIANIPAAGNSNTIQQYSFLDQNPLTESNYYRLKMVDGDGHFIYSQTILLKNPNARQTIWVLNNPFDRFIKVRLAKTPQHSVQFDLISPSATKLYHKEFGSSDEFTLDFSSINLAKGAYFLRANIDGQLFTHKLIKN